MTWEISKLTKPSRKVKELCDKNFSTLGKETEEDVRRWKDPQCSWIGGLTQ